MRRKWSRKGCSEVRRRLSESGFLTLKFENFELSAFQVVDLLEIKTGFPYYGTLKLWRIERVKLKENWIWPICLFNEGNDFAQTQNYEMNDWRVSVMRSSEIRMTKLLKQKCFIEMEFAFSAY
jgi:hypothetical protein